MSQETSAEIIPIAAGTRMSEADYDRARAALRETYGDKGAQAAARWEQELALLFARSGWTQEELAAKEGKSHGWVVHALRFGRFLISRGNVTGCDILREGRFRRFWEQTAEQRSSETRTAAETRRFNEVAELVADAEANKDNKTVGEITGKVVRDRFVDGRWHTLDAIAKAADQPVEGVQRALFHMKSNTAPKRYKVEHERIAKGHKFRFFKMDKPISSQELVEKLSPLIAKLKSQAKTNMATVDITMFGHVASQLQKLLDEWTQ